MPFVRFAAFAIMIVAVGASSSFAQPRPDPFDDQFKAASGKNTPPVVLPDFVPQIPADAPLGLVRLVELIDLQAWAKPTKVKRGEIVRITIDGLTKPYAYTYSAVKRHDQQTGDSPKIRFEDAPWVKPLFPIIESEATLKGKGEDAAYILYGKFQWQQDIYIALDAPLGKQRFVVQPFMQVCTKKEGNPRNEEICLPARTYRPLRIALEILDGDPVPPPADLEARLVPPKFAPPPPVAPPTTSPTTTPPAVVPFADLGGLLFGAFAGAILMLLTPCVFPMIPITVNFFIKQSEKEHHRPLSMASVYAGTIVALLTCVVVLVGQSIIVLASNAWFNLGLGVVLIVFSLGLFGMFEVDLTKFFGTVLLIVTGFLISLAAKRTFPWIEENNYDFPLAVASLILAVPAMMLLGRGVRLAESALGLEESALLNFLARQESRGGSMGAIFMAMTFTITSFSCTGPFLGIILAPLAGTTLPKSHLVLAALVYSITFAAPFFVLALFPTYLKKLPRSGGWMTTIKVTMGFLEVGAALKFLSIADLTWFPGDPRLFNYDTVLCSWIALSVACSLYLFGLYRLGHDSPEDHISVPRMIFASIFLGMAFYLSPLLFGIAAPKGMVMDAAVAFLPPNFKAKTGGPNGAGGHDAIPWIEHDYAAAWKKAVAEKKLIFIDFTGQNCANCRENERNVFPRADVIAELKKYVCVQLYTDIVPRIGISAAASRSEAEINFERQIQLINDVAQPSYVIVDPNREQPFSGDRIDAKVLGFRTGKIFDAADFVRFLQEPLKGRNEAGQQAIHWIDDDYATAWEQGVREGKQLFVRFYGRNNAYERVEERNVIDSTEVARELDRFVCVKLAIDLIAKYQDSPTECRSLTEKHNELLLDLTGNVQSPAYVVVQPSPNAKLKEGFPVGEVIGQWQGRIRHPNRFVAFLRDPKNSAC